MKDRAIQSFRIVLTIIGLILFVVYSGRATSASTDRKVSGTRHYAVLSSQEDFSALLTADHGTFRSVQDFKPSAATDRTTAASPVKSAKVHTSVPARTRKAQVGGVTVRHTAVPKPVHAELPAAVLASKTTQQH